MSRDDEGSRSAPSTSRAKEEEIETEAAMEVMEQVLSQLGRVEEEANRLATTREEIVSITEQIVQTSEEIVHTTDEEIVLAPEEMAPALEATVLATEEIIRALEEIVHSRDEEIALAPGEIIPALEDIVQAMVEIIQALEETDLPDEEVVPAREDIVPIREVIVQATEEVVHDSEEIIYARDEEIVEATEEIVPALEEATEEIVPALEEITQAGDEDTDHDDIPPLSDAAVVNIPDESVPAQIVSATRFFSDRTVSMIIGVLTGLLVGFQLNITASVVSSPLFINWLSRTILDDATRSSRLSVCRYWLSTLRAFAVVGHISALLTIAFMTISTLVRSHVSPRTLLVAGSISHMIASLLVMLSPSFSPLMLGVFLQGIGVGAALQVMELHRRDMTSPQKVLMKTYHDFGAALGPVLGNGIHFWLASRGVRHAWKISLSSSGFISMTLFTMFLCLKTDSRILQRASARQPWRRLSERVGWPQLITAIVRAIVTRSTDLSVFTYLLTTYFGSSTETTTMVISLICLWDVFWKAVAYRCALRAVPFAIAAFVMAVMQVAIGTFQVERPIVTSEPVRRSTLPSLIIMGAVYMAARGWLSSPSRWLRHLHAGEVSLASITIVQMTDVLVQLLFGWYSIPIICWLVGRIFFVMAVQALLATIFIIVAVPETSEADSGEQQREMLRRRHIWRFFLGQPTAP